MPNQHLSQYPFGSYLLNFDESERQHRQEHPLVPTGFCSPYNTSLHLHMPLLFSNAIPIQNHLIPQERDCRFRSLYGWALCVPWHMMRRVDVRDWVDTRPLL